MNAYENLGCFFLILGVSPIPDLIIHHRNSVLLSRKILNKAGCELTCACHDALANASLPIRSGSSFPPPVTVSPVAHLA